MSAALEGRIAGNFFGLDLADVRRELAKLPWVRRVEARREWPDRIVVRFEEHRALGALGATGGSSTPRASSSTPTPTATLPQLAGPAGTEREVARRYRAFRELVAPLGTEPTHVTLSPRYAWQVRLANGLALELGRDQARQSLEERLARFVAAYPRAAGAPQPADRLRRPPLPERFCNPLAGGARCGRPPAQANLIGEATMKKQLSYAGPISADTVEHLFDTEAPIRPEPAAARAPYGGRARRDQRNLIVALDIGTSKVVALVADLTPDGRLEVIGMGTHESRGLKKGVVVNIEATVSAIQRALEEAELMADCKIQRVYTGIAGSHIRSFNSTGMVAVKDKEVTPLDVDRAIETARAMPIPTDQQVLHILTQEFLIDGQDGDARAARHVGRAPRGEGAHRHRRGVARRRTS